MPVDVSQEQARRIWLHAQKLDSPAPFGGGAEATPAAIAHLGYVQIDTINVIERCHHHILWTRIPDYRREHLRRAQTIDKTVFEYWTHALSYIPTRDMAFFIGDMRQQRKSPKNWFGSVSEKDLRRIIARVRDSGALSIRDIDDDELVEKNHAWASRKPSKRALQLAFHIGKLTVSERSGMLKTYELMDRHFQWDKPPRKASERQVADYLLDRALRSQGLVSLDSVCHLNPRHKPSVRRAVETRMKRGELLAASIQGAGRIEYWCRPETLDRTLDAVAGVHILSPFDPLVIQRKRLKLFFGYEHVFEAYIPREKRVYGYFGLPVLLDGDIVAVLDLKADRARGELLLQKWSWVGRGGSSARKRAIEEKLQVFEQFQFAS